MKFNTETFSIRNIKCSSFGRSEFSLMMTTEISSIFDSLENRITRFCVEAENFPTFPDEWRVHLYFILEPICSFRSGNLSFTFKKIS